jgi:hypothetical protein
VGIPLLSDHIETCFTNVLEHIIKLIKEKFIEDTPQQPLEEEKVKIDDRGRSSRLKSKSNRSSSAGNRLSRIADG